MRIFFLRVPQCRKQQSKPNYKKRYRDFIDNFRKAINTNFYQQQSTKSSPEHLIKQIQKTAFIFFTKIKMDDFHTRLTKYVAFKGGIPSLISPHIKHPMSKSINGKIEIIKQQTIYLNKIWQALRQGKVFNLTTIKRAYSSYLGGTTWSKLDIQPSRPSKNQIKRRSKIITYPLNFYKNVYSKIGSNRQHINPEFRAYIDYLNSQNLVHSYINLQDNRHTDIYMNYQLCKYQITRN